MCIGEHLPPSSQGGAVNSWECEYPEFVLSGLSKKLTRTQKGKELGSRHMKQPSRLPPHRGLHASAPPPPPPTNSDII